MYSIPIVIKSRGEISNLITSFNDEMNFICIMKQITDTEESVSELAKQVNNVIGLHKYQGRQQQPGFSTNQQKCTQNMYFFRDWLA